MTAYRISQIELVSHICKWLDRQGVKTVVPRQTNAVIQAANLIVDALAEGERVVTPGMGLTAWLMTDQTGMSSEFMACTLAPLIGERTRPRNYAYPHDPSDLGRCLGLLDAVPAMRPHIAAMAETGTEWKALVRAWDELESLYREEFPSGKAPKCFKRMQEVLGLS